MQTRPAKLIGIALVAVLFGLAGAASRTCETGDTSILQPPGALHEPERLASAAARSARLSLR